ncbi:hypothetical protein MVES1_000490 [Malassezia vespertilionis]|uniref:Uncharacterized protein n=1 Tax=Malassezia vespertilionis TaxID=2020962 RepID=A0A2N1JG33_9BASI|nr:uncharacterized protein MVES1_000490 [Malassezia vespertilionis]PKI85510.1 hypothetical protein MVES_000453 [Malassezia vespertilionis]WFD05164.1 hypothetical protein MVES1_000490 [Malassezia vespertilionis]
MPWQLIEVDALSVALLASIVILVVLVKYQQQHEQPLLHPLILSHQSDASQVRSPGESPIYRNVNAPLGFDLAMRPRRTAPNVAALLGTGVTDSEASHARRILDTFLSPKELRSQAAAFAHGITALLGAHKPTIIVYGQITTAHALCGLLAATVAEAPIATLVVPDGASPHSLPAGIDTKNVALVCVDANYPIPPSLSSASLIITGTSQHEAAKRVAPHAKICDIFDVLGLSAEIEPPAVRDTSKLRSGELDQIGAQTFAQFYEPRGRCWVRATQTSMTSGVTAWLSEYPADKIPSEGDTILTDAHADMFLPAPAYVSLLLMALYSGAAITSEPTKGVMKALRATKPTLLYLSPIAAGQLKTLLWIHASSSLLYPIAFRIGVHALRKGKFALDSLADRLVFSGLRNKFGARVRATVIFSNAVTLDQAALDHLRLFLASPVMHAYMPSVLVTSNAKGIVTAPVSASNIYDLQAFQPQPIGPESKRRLAPHTGPAAVSMELKLVQDTPAVEAHSAVLEYLQRKDGGAETDPIGEIYVRGYSLAHSSAPNPEADMTLSAWFATGDVGLARTNGTLVVVAPHGATEAGILPDETMDSAVLVPIPTETAAQPKLGKTKITVTSRTSSAMAAAPAVLAMLAFGVASVDASAHTHTHTHSMLARRADAPAENLTSMHLALDSLLTSQRASWEQGVAQSAVLELFYPEYSTFSKSDKKGAEFYPPQKTDFPEKLLSLAFHSVTSQDKNGRLATIITGDEALNTGASQDSASCGEGVLIAAWCLEGFPNSAPDPRAFYGGGAQRELTYLRRNVSRSQNGAISQRATPGDVQFWSDTMYMGPPFFATYGLMTNNAKLISLAYNQVRLLRQYLLFSNTTSQGLYGHIVKDNGKNVIRWLDSRPWLTGNAWVGAGMLRVLATMTHTDDAQFQAPQNDLRTWIEDLLQVVYKQADPNTGLLRNDLGNTSSFMDGSGSALMAYNAFRFASMVPDKTQFVDFAEKVYMTLSGSLAPDGSFTSNVQIVNELSTGEQSTTSAESLAFLTMLYAARRDYYAGNVTGSSGPVEPLNKAGNNQASDSAADGIASASMALVFTSVCLSSLLLWIGA